MRSKPKARAIDRIVKRLQRDYQPMQVILFGSYAYGHPTRHSDLDLLIVKETTKPFFQRMFEVRRLLSPLLRHQPFDPIVMTPQELQQRLARGDQFFQGIVKRGKPLYGKRLRVALPKRLVSHRGGGFEACRSATGGEASFRCHIR